MAHRPHLVIDGAILAAEAIGADEIVFYVGEEHDAAGRAMARAIHERRIELKGPVRLVKAPISYVAGEASAAVNFINTGDALPTTTPPRVSERGVGERRRSSRTWRALPMRRSSPGTAHEWYRSAGRLESAGTALITITGAASAQGVRRSNSARRSASSPPMQGLGRRIQAVVLGGYFGTWAAVGDAWDLPLDPVAMKRRASRSVAGSSDFCRRTSAACTPPRRSWRSWRPRAQASAARASMGCERSGTRRDESPTARPRPTTSVTSIAGRPRWMDEAHAVT